MPKWVVGDRGYSGHGFREHIWTRGARLAIPATRNEEQLACLDWVYNNRNVVERLWARLERWCAVATRYETAAVHFTPDDSA
ncbi:IS5 family transposase [Methylorubrum extorquens]|uniref:IS5 family transposase n=1 Tax=Methylorubrum extorquens TaxID=408 RepID=A0A1S1PAW6_METEX|nr:IS5 family transposase [Methylorubrum extorquens]